MKSSGFSGEDAKEHCKVNSQSRVVYQVINGLVFHSFLYSAHLFCSLYSIDVTFCIDAKIHHNVYNVPCLRFLYS